LDKGSPGLEGILEELDESWWLFMPTAGYCEYNGLKLWPREWTLINYEKRRMYGGPDAKSFYTWKDAWNVSKL
jgi:hypothetical protein